MSAATHPQPVDYYPYELTVLIPVMNEEESLRPMLDRVCDALKGLGKPWELILVDDGSTDRTLLYAREYLGREGLDLKIIEFQRNFGKAAAYQAGFDAAQGRLIVTLDGDLQNDPHDIPAMIAELEARDLDLLAGWRKARQDALVLRKIPSWCANRLIGWVTGVNIHDNGCGLKLYRSSIIKQVQIIGGMHRFIPAWVASVIPSTRIGETVVTHHPRQFGESKYGISRTFRVFLDLLSVLFFMRFKARPGHFFGMIGLVLGFLSGVIFLYLAYVKFILGEDIGTRPLLLAGVVLFLSSMQMITTGIVAELITRSYMGSENAPLYIVRATHRKEG
ncbi:glycosyltransferase family 2 protein [Rhizobium sp. LC145]|jgi:glycosyltransferase involved in cell wall biosynthesis|uniref:glycosyltransferase family 2 protein n=1 Tax=Rhizobium sp. LC145 TaxID=1120688 RepID=UPI000629FE60|nr:glycosyltransferase family 2 protein [Rhizobium sp. LC145]KKX28014.1 family 2 glycosyl transferase [Rhizobium sp. LC145]TKT46351.1 glycosyltransferase family 2 protein [Rhizobiaceae bacterium LC148]